METYEIIDCRARPDTPEFLATLQNPQLLNDMRKFHRTPPCQPKDLQECLAFFKEQGLSGAVCMGRDMDEASCNIRSGVSNESIASLMKNSEGFIIGVAGINPLKKDCTVTARKAAKDLGLKGVSIDPAFMDLYPDDRRIYPLYEELQSLKMPVFITLGPRPFGHGTKICYCNPLSVDTVAGDFPDLHILVSHGGFPWMQEMCAIAFRNDNVWFETSAYWFMPGVKTMFVEGANGYLAEKVCFGSAYPFAPIKETIEALREWPFKQDVLPRFFGQNIKEFLNN